MFYNYVSSGQRDWHSEPSSSYSAGDRKVSRKPKMCPVGELMPCFAQPVPRLPHLLQAFDPRAPIRNLTHVIASLASAALNSMCTPLCFVARLPRTRSLTCLCLLLTCAGMYSSGNCTIRTSLVLCRPQCHHFALHLLVFKTQASSAALIFGVALARLSLARPLPQRHTARGRKSACFGLNWQWIPQEQRVIKLSSRRCPQQRTTTRIKLRGKALPK